MWRALSFCLMLLVGCGSDVAPGQVGRLEKDLEQAKKKNRELNEQVASCLETRKLLEAELAAQKKLDDTLKGTEAIPSAAESARPPTPTKPRPRCDPGDPLCSEI